MGWYWRLKHGRDGGSSGQDLFTTPGAVPEGRSASAWLMASGAQGRLSGDSLDLCVWYGWGLSKS